MICSMYRYDLAYVKEFRRSSPPFVAVNQGGSGSVSMKAGHLFLNLCAHLTAGQAGRPC